MVYTKYVSVDISVADLGSEESGGGGGRQGFRGLAHRILLIHFCQFKGLFKVFGENKGGRSGRAPLHFRQILDPRLVARVKIYKCFTLSGMCFPLDGISESWGLTTCLPSHSLVVSRGGGTKSLCTSERHLLRRAASPLERGII